MKHKNLLFPVLGLTGLVGIVAFLSSSQKPAPHKLDTSRPVQMRSTGPGDISPYSKNGEVYYAFDLITGKYVKFVDYCSKHNFDGADGKPEYAVTFDDDTLSNADYLLSHDSVKEWQSMYAEVREFIKNKK